MILSNFTWDNFTVGRFTKGYGTLGNLLKPHEYLNYGTLRTSSESCGVLFSAV